MDSRDKSFGVWALEFVLSFALWIWSFCQKLALVNRSRPYGSSIRVLLPLTIPLR
jgi:hypothetical protein